MTGISFESREWVNIIYDLLNRTSTINDVTHIYGKDYPEVYISEGQLVGNGSYTCEECERGRLVLAFPNRINGYAWQCSLNPYCPGKSKFCSKCMQAPLSQCMNPDCMVV